MNYNLIRQISNYPATGYLTIRLPEPIFKKLVTFLISFFSYFVPLNIRDDLFRDLVLDFLLLLYIPF